jgi:uroporphyrinogen III methyltransferase/synthase
LSDGTPIRAAITRSPEAAAALAGLLARDGGSLAAYPLIRIEPTAAPGLARAAAGIERYDWVVVTSAHAASALAGALAAARPRASWPASVRVAAIGAATARALEAHGIPVAITPPGAEHGAGMVAALIATERAAGGEGATPLSGRRILFPASDRARPEVPALLRQAGAEVEAVEAYRNRPEPEHARALAAALRVGRFDALVCSSPSNVEALAVAAGPDWPGLLDHVRVIAIGPATGAELAARGRPADAEAASPDPAGLAEALAGRERSREPIHPRRDRASNA